MKTLIQLIKTLIKVAVLSIDLKYNAWKAGLTYGTTRNTKAGL